MRSHAGRGGEHEVRAIARGTVRHVGRGLYVADPPPALPLRFERPFTVANQTLRGSFVARAARGLGFERPLLWIHDIDAARVVKRLDPMGLDLLGHRRSSDRACVQS